MRVAGRRRGGTGRGRRGVYGCGGRCAGGSVLPGDGGSRRPRVIRAASPAAQLASTPARSMIELCDHGQDIGEGHAGVRLWRPAVVFPSRTLDSWVSSAGVDLRLNMPRPLSGRGRGVFQDRAHRQHHGDLDLPQQVGARRRGCESRWKSGKAPVRQRQHARRQGSQQMAAEFLLADEPRRTQHGPLHGSRTPPTPAPGSSRTRIERLREVLGASHSSHDRSDSFRSAAPHKMTDSIAHRVQANAPMSPSSSRMPRCGLTRPLASAPGRSTGMRWRPPPTSCGGAAPAAWTDPNSGATARHVQPGEATKVPAHSGLAVTGPPSATALRTPHLPRRTPELSCAAQRAHRPCEARSEWRVLLESSG